MKSYLTRANIMQADNEPQKVCTCRKLLLQLSNVHGLWSKQAEVHEYGSEIHLWGQRHVGMSQGVTPLAEGNWWGRGPILGYAACPAAKTILSRKSIRKSE